MLTTVYFNNKKILPSILSLSKFETKHEQFINSIFIKPITLLV